MSLNSSLQYPFMLHSNQNLTKTINSKPSGSLTFKLILNSSLVLDYLLKLDLKYVRIYFDATTFDKITKDRAAKFVDMLSAIGGTLGLLTGFSIISGVEILYFSVKIILQAVKERVTGKYVNKNLKIV